MKALGCAILAAGACLPACRAGGDHPSGREVVPLKVLAIATPSYAPLFVALDEGFFDEQRLAVELVTLRRSGDGLPAVMQGDLDVTGDFLGAAYLNAMARGARVRIVADKGYIPLSGCDSNAFVASPALVEKAGSKKAGFLKGLRIGSNPRSVSGYFAERMLEGAGLPDDAVEIVDVPRAIMEQAIGRSVDVGFLMEPAVTRALKGGHGAVWLSAQQLAPDFQLASIFYGPSLLDGNPDAGRRFLVAYLKAVRQLNEGKTARNLEILARHTGDDPALLRDACWPAFRRDGRINARSVHEFQSWALEKGLLDRPATEDQFWDPTFVDHANRVLDGGDR